MAQEQSNTGAPAPEGLVTITHVIYGLHAFSALTGLLSPAFVVTAFLTGWPSIIGVIINYAKRDEAYGTYLESHFRWQIRTFWFSLLWAVVGAILSLVFVGFLILGATCIWVIYRIVKGWLRLSEGKAMYV
jgi:uncharacterized membrane protein